MVKLKQSGETKPLQLAAAHPDMPDCTGGSSLGRREMWLSLAHTGPRSCICSCLRNLPFLSFYWGKGRWKGTLFIPHPSCLPNLNLLNHRWIVVLWFSAKGGPPLWDVLWAVLHQALDQGGLSGVMTWCKSTKTGPRISGRKGCWWGISCEKHLGLKQNWLWREKVLSDERAHHISCPDMFWIFGVGIKLETEEEERIVMRIAMGLLQFMNNSMCFNYHVKWRQHYLCTAPEHRICKLSSCLAIYQPLENCPPRPRRPLTA